MKKWIGILTFIQLHVLFAENESLDSIIEAHHQQYNTTARTNLEKQLQPNDFYDKLFKRNENRENELKNSYLDSKLEIMTIRDHNLESIHFKRILRSLKNKPSLSEMDQQFEQFCRVCLPCTCYYPDHTDVVQFELSTDDITRNVTSKNGNGPASCQDLEHIGYHLDGFYLVRFGAANRVKTVFCSFSNAKNHNNKQKFPEKQTSLKQNNDVTMTLVQSYDKSSSIVKHIRLCGGVGSHPCAFMYADYPDISYIDPKSSEYEARPTSCQDLQKVGYTNKGFYFIYLNGMKVRIVFCDFDPSMGKEIDEGQTALLTSKHDAVSSPERLRCNVGIGSKPCSCHRSDHSDKLQIELSTDEVTRHASSKTGPGPSSCKDLEIIGHTLEGFYMIRNNGKKMIIVYCKFYSKEKEEERKTMKSNSMTRPVVKDLEITSSTISSTIRDLIISTFEPTNVPVRAGNRVSIEQSAPNLFTNLPIQNANTISKETKSLILNPATTLIGKEVFKINTPPTTTQITATSTDRATTKAKSKSFKLGKKIPLEHKDENSYLLRHNTGKCLAVSTIGPKRDSDDGAKIIMSDCNPSEKGQLWKLTTFNYTSRGQTSEASNLCNEWDKCLTVDFRWYNGYTSNIFHWENIDGEERQMWSPYDRLSSISHFGLFLSVNENSNPQEVVLNYMGKSYDRWSFYTWNN